MKMVTLKECCTFEINFYSFMNAYKNFMYICGVILLSKWIYLW